MTNIRDLPMFRRPMVTEPVVCSGSSAVSMPPRRMQNSFCVALLLAFLVGATGCGESPDADSDDVEVSWEWEETAEPEDRPPLPPPEPLRISADTTLLTGPLTEDGRVDYLAVLNEEASAGVTAETNGMAAMLAATGVAHESYSDEFRERLFGALNIPVPDRDGPHLIYGEDFAIHVHGQDAEAGRALERTIREKSCRPWSRGRDPMVAKWLDANQERLSAAVDSLDSPAYYCPLISVADDHHFVRHTRTPAVETVRVIEALVTRSMLATFEGRSEDAVSDILATHRLAQRTLQGRSDFEMVVAATGHNLACRALPQIVEWCPLSDEQLLTLAEELNKGTTPSGLAETMVRFQRFDVLNLAATFAGRDESVWEEEYPNSGTRNLAKCHNDIDWNIVLQKVNQRFNAMDEALQLSDRLERHEALNQVYQQVALERGLMGIVATGFASGESGYDRQGLSETVADFIIDNTFGELIVHWIEDKWHMNQQLARIVVAVERYRRRTGGLPRNLEDITPEFLPSVPEDRLSPQPLAYVPGDDQYLLYSHVANSVVDGEIVGDHYSDSLAVLMKIREPLTQSAD